MAHHPARHGPGSRPKPGRSVVSGMYSICLFCHAPLGTNESIEHFPVGRRLAFDGAKGRLWVICGVCERWNLMPLDERWQAIEECERSFRASRLRVSTDNVGMARLREGTTLVRIGEPQRPELAAWRYGDQFGRRRRRHIVTTTAVVAAVAGIVVAAVAGIVVAGPVTGLVSGGAVNLINAGNLVWRFRSVARITVGGDTYNLSRQALLYVELKPNEDSGYELEVPFMWPLNTRLSLFTRGRRTARARGRVGGARAALDGSRGDRRHQRQHVSAARDH
jgi:hypothetical protein